MENWIQWLSEEWAGITVGIIAMLAIIAVCLRQVSGKWSYNALDRMLMPKGRYFVYFALRCAALYGLLQILMLWVSHTGLPSIMTTLLRQYSSMTLTLLATCLAAIAVCWIVLWTTKRKANLIFISLLYAFTVSCLFVPLVNLYQAAIAGSSMTWIEYVLHPYALLILLLVMTLSAYARQQIRMESLGVLSPEQLRGQSLEVLYTLRRNQQVLRDEREPDLYYLHDMSANLYYKYKVEIIAGKRRTARRKPSKSQDAAGNSVSRMQTRVQKHKKNQIPL